METEAPPVSWLTCNRPHRDTQPAHVQPGSLGAQVCRALAHRWAGGQERPGEVCEDERDVSVPCTQCLDPWGDSGTDPPAVPVWETGRAPHTCGHRDQEKPAAGPQKGPRTHSHRAGWPIPLRAALLCGKNLQTGGQAAPEGSGL